MRDQRAEVSLTIAPDERIESEPIENRSFRILLLGDFGAREDAAPLATEPPRRVDRDDLDAALARVAPRLRLTLDDALPAIELGFASMDDFHPDRLLPLVTGLRADAGAPGDSRTRTEVGANDRPAPAAPNAGGTPTAPPAATVAAALSGTSLLEHMLDATGAPAPATTRASRPDDLAQFVERAVAPHIVRAPDAAAAAKAADDDRDAARLLRLLLHHPRFQALEAAWRSVEMLVRRLDTDTGLDLFIADTPREQAGLALERLARQRAAAADDGWALVVALHAFPDGDAGAEMLARIAIAAGELDVPCVAGAPPAFTGRRAATDLDDDETEPAAAPEVYSLIRRSREGRYLGLTFPRVMLRAPYGRDNPCDTVDFEEIDDPERRDQFLWGSAATLVALVVGEAFLERGWAIGPRLALDVGSLPLFTYRRGPEMLAASCAEIVMSERVARHLLSRGIIPVAWIKGTDRVRLVELRSVADGPAPLAAAWIGAGGA